MKLYTKLMRRKKCGWLTEIPAECEKKKCDCCGGEKGEGNSMTNKDAIAILKSDKCFCGKKKEPMRVFCLDCYMKLPVKQQHALYKKIGAGFSEAVEAATNWLKDRAKK